jgi:hypothetical protein
MRKKSELTILFIVLLLSMAVGSACASDADSQAEEGASKAAVLTAAPLATLPTAKGLTASYRLHSTRRVFIANRLNYLWYWEKEVDAERGRCGRAGDMASVIRLERDLLAIRDEIELMLGELSRVNKVISLIDEQLELE